MDFSPQELDAVESRADQLYRLKKKYGATVGEMLDYLERSKKELDEIEYADDRIVQLQGTLAKQEKEMLAADEVGFSRYFPFSNSWQSRLDSFASSNE